MEVLNNSAVFRTLKLSDLCVNYFFTLSFSMIVVVDFGSSKVPEIVTAVAGLGLPALSLKWNVTEQPEFLSASGIILSGAPVLLTKTDPTPYLKRFAFIKDLQIPVLGICFGHQLLGMLYGAKVFLGKENRENTEIEILKSDPLFTGLSAKPVFAEDHTEGIDLPPGFIHLARSNDYKVEAMKHPAKNMYGVQFHPEVPGKNGEIVLGNFCGMIKS